MVLRSIVAELVSVSKTSSSFIEERIFIRSLIKSSFATPSGGITIPALIKRAIYSDQLRPSSIVTPPSAKFSKNFAFPNTNLSSLSKTHMPAADLSIAFDRTDIFSVLFFSSLISEDTVTSPPSSKRVVVSRLVPLAVFLSVMSTSTISKRCDALCSIKSSSETPSGIDTIPAFTKSRR